MQQFARLFPDPRVVQAPLAQLTWYHIIALMDKVKDPDARGWYARQAVENGWSRNVMVIQIERQAIASERTPSMMQRIHTR